MAGRLLQINHSYLAQLARNRAYGWMSCLKPIRAAITQRTSGKSGCCRNNRPTPRIPESAYAEVLVQPSLRRDLRELQRLLGFDGVVLTVNRQRIELLG